MNGWKVVASLFGFVLLLCFVLFRIQVEEWDVRHDQGREALDHDDYQKAEPLLRSAYNDARRSGAPPYEMGEILGDLGEAYEGLKDATHAEACYLQGVELLEKSSHLDNPDFHYHLERLGGFYLEQKRFREAEPYLVRAYAIGERILASDDQFLAQHANLLGSLYMRMRRYDEAEKLLKQAYSIDKKVLKPNDPTLLNDKQALELLEEFKRKKIAVVEPR